MAWQPTPGFLPGESHARGAKKTQVNRVAKTDLNTHLIHTRLTESTVGGPRLVRGFRKASLKK